MKIPHPIKRRKDKLPVSMRTANDERQYEKVKASRPKKDTALHEARAIQEWVNWKLIPNTFPYTAVFKVHHLLVPKRIVSEDELTTKERKELEEIIAELRENYDCLLLNFTSKQSIKNHLHLHFLTYKDKRSELSL